MNSWSFTGNLGKDCEVRHIASGEAIVSFSVAVKAGFGEKATTTWARCSMWGKRGEAVAPYLLSGQLVGITGEASMRPWKNKEGIDQQSLEVRVNDLTLLGRKGDAAPKPASDAPASGSQQAAGDFDDDIPFN
jgi:single-strand DNA-binding protein